MNESVEDAYSSFDTDIIADWTAVTCTHIVHIINKEVMVMRLTVGSVIAIFRDQLQLGRYRHQYDLMDTLLSDYLCEHVDYILHAPAVSA